MHLRRRVISLWCKILYYLFGKELKKSLTSFRENVKENISIDSLIPEFLKSEFKNIELPKYKVSTHWQLSDCRTPDYAFYLDANYVFILSGIDGEDNEISLACLAFNPFGAKSICIRQIQGAYSDYNKRVSILKPIKWERMMIKIVCQWARQHKIRNVYMISATESNWYNDDRHNQMYMRYDVTAKRMGFKYNPLKKLYRSSAYRFKQVAV